MIEALAGGPHGISMQLDVVRPSLEGSVGSSGSPTILPILKDPRSELPTNQYMHTIPNETTIRNILWSTEIVYLELLELETEAHCILWRHRYWTPWYLKTLWEKPSVRTERKERHTIGSQKSSRSTNTSWSCGEVSWEVTSRLGHIWLFFYEGWAIEKQVKVLGFALSPPMVVKNTSKT